MPRDVRCGGYRDEAIHFGVREGTRNIPIFSSTRVGTGCVGRMLRAACEKDDPATMLIVDGIGVTTTCCVGNVPEFGADAGSSSRVLLLLRALLHRSTITQLVRWFRRDTSCRRQREWNKEGGRIVVWRAIAHIF